MTRTIDLVVGVLLLILAVATVLRMLTRDRAAPPADSDATSTARGGHDGLGSAALLGAAMMIGNFSTILLYLPAMHEIVRSRADDADKGVALVVAVVITSLPATLPLLVRVAAPGPAARSFSAMHAWVTRHSSQVALVVEVVFGIWLLSKAG